MAKEKEKRRALTPGEQAKTIIVEFADGPKDGLVFRSDSEDLKEAERALRFYLVHSEGGTIGKRFRTKSDADDETKHIYEVTDRGEDETTIRVRFQYMGDED